MHERSSFLTLTYNQEFLPPDHSLHVRDMQLFMKRLRKGVGHPVRFFCCGEYGDDAYRPHYHLLLFGKDFPDMYPWRKTESGFVVYRSAELEKYWPCGHAEIGTVTPESCGYVARYCLKKINGRDAKKHYLRTDTTTGETWSVRPEFCTMSTKPGIGSDWYDAFHMDAFPSDFVIMDGEKRPIPRYYAKKLEKAVQELKDKRELDKDYRPTQLEEVKDERKINARKHAGNNTPERLAVREEVLRLRLQQLHRELDTQQ